MTTIMLIRHGETDWNVEEIFRGGIDIELNETGIKQAQLLAKYLADVPITATYSSPLRRALKTADIIVSYHSVSIEIAPELTDFDYGERQGLSHGVVKERYKELHNEWLRSPHLVRMPNGESLDDSHFWNIKLDTCGLTTFTYEDESFVLTRHNDTSFLKPIERATLSDF